MSWPTDEQIQEALAVIAPDLRRGTSARHLWAYEILQVATTSRPVWGALEVANCLGVSPSNLRQGSMRGFDELPAPCQELPRPTSADPGKTMRLWYADEIEALAAKWRAEGRGAK